MRSSLVFLVACVCAGLVSSQQPPVVSFFASCPAGTSVCYAISKTDFGNGCAGIGGQVASSVHLAKWWNPNVSI